MFVDNSLNLGVMLKLDKSVQGVLAKLIKCLRSRGFIKSKFNKVNLIK